MLKEKIKASPDHGKMVMSGFFAANVILDKKITRGSMKMEGKMNPKVTLILWGAALGLVAACLAFLGNPGNMAFCIACFIRDMAEQRSSTQRQLCSICALRS